MSAIRKILDTIQKHQLIRPGDKIIVGVSGGADSTALLFLLNDLRGRLGFQIHVVHINHHLRKTSGRDEQFVRKLCSTLRLPVTVVHLRLGKKLRAKGSLEEIAREGRFNALCRLARKLRADAVALAHQEDDLAETVLMRILRGTGLQGLSAILKKRAINGQNFIRPLLDTRRAEILAYLRAQKLKYKTDETNSQTIFLRNKIRLKLLPLLSKEYQTNITAALAHLALTSGDDYDFLRQEAGKRLLRCAALSGNKVALDLVKLQNAHPSMRRMLIRLALEQLKGDNRMFEFRHLQAIEQMITSDFPTTSTDLPGGYRVQRSKKTLTFTRTT